MSQVVLVSTRKGLFPVERSDAGPWRIAMPHFLGDNVTLALADRRDGAWYAALDHGHFGVKLQRSGDRGKTWQELAVPAYPAQEPGTEVIDFFGRTVPNTLSKIWALAAAGPDQPGVLWAGTIPGGLFKSTDLGVTWQIVESLWNDPRRRQWGGAGADWPGIHSICVDPRDSRRVTIAISSGGIWRTDDSGATWRLTGKGLRAEYVPPDKVYDPLNQDVHHLVQCRDAPECFWVQHHNGIFWSIDGCESFVEVTRAVPSAFGFTVAVHPQDPKTAWFVPAIKDEKRMAVGGQVVVSRTRDRADSFEILRDGLPQEQAWDLVYRHALDIDATGQRLAFGSTTGALWLSEDGGDHWTELSAHLPPVYAVTFT